MTLKSVFTEGGQIVHSAGSPITGGTFKITSIADPKVSVDGDGVFFQKVDFTFSGGSATGVTAGSVAGSGSIASTAVNVSTSLGGVMRDGDTGTLSGAGANPSPPPPTIAVTGSVELVDTQTKVRAE